MAKYHLNYKGEAGACSASKGNCPFGGESDHFSSPEAARAAYESAHAAFANPVKKAPAPSSTKRKTTNHTSWKDDLVPSVENSKVIAKPAINDDSGYMGGRRWRGGKVPEGYLSQKEAAKLVRGDIAEAVKVGELPKDLSYSVRSASGAWVTSINILVGDKNAAGRPVPLSDEDKRDGRIESVKRYLSALGNQFSTDESNAQFDYFNSSNRARVDFLY